MLFVDISCPNKTCEDFFECDLEHGAVEGSVKKGSHHLIECPECAATITFEVGDDIATNVDDCLQYSLVD